MSYENDLEQITKLAGRIGVLGYRLDMLRSATVRALGRMEAGEIHTATAHLRSALNALEWLEKDDPKDEPASRGSETPSLA